MKKLIFGLVAVGTLTVITLPAQASSNRAKQANCELRLTAQAGVGEAFMSIFTPNEEECLAKSDEAVEAKFRSTNGQVIGQRGGGSGPQP